MTGENNEAAKAKRTRATRSIARPPYASAGDIDQMFERIRTIAAPTELTGPWAKGFGLASDTPTVLKWLGVAKDGKVDQGLWDEVRVPATRRGALDRLVRTAYAPIFDQVDVSEASKDVLSGAFITKYKMGDPIRYVRAFLTLCRHAGIGAGVDEADGETKVAAATTKSRPAPKKAPAEPRRGDPAPAPSRLDGADARPAIAVNVEIPASWTEEQIKERLATVRRALGEPDS